MKTAAILLVAVTLSTSLFLQSSAAPDPVLSTLFSDLGNDAQGLGKIIGTGVEDIGLFVKGTIGTLVGKGGKTCAAYVLLLKNLGVVLQAAQERLYALLTDMTKELDKAIANASGDLKELLTKLNALLKVLLEALPKLLKGLVAAVANPTEENLNKVEVDLQQLEQILAKLAELITKDTAGTLPSVYKFITIAVYNSARDGLGAFGVVVQSLRGN